MIHQAEISAHAAAEEWPWECETGCETGPFWRKFAPDFFTSKVHQFLREYR